MQQGRISSFFSRPAKRKASSQGPIIEEGSDCDSNDSMCSLSNEGFQEDLQVAHRVSSLLPDSSLSGDSQADQACTSSGADTRDLGLILKSHSSSSISRLTPGEKYGLLFRHVSPPWVFPTTHKYGCNRRFNAEWLKKISWLIYSPAVGGVFYEPCAVLLGETERMDKGALVTTPFSNWVKISEQLSNRAKNK